MVEITYFFCCLAVGNQFEASSGGNVSKQVERARQKKAGLAGTRPGGEFLQGEHLQRADWQVRPAEAEEEGPEDGGD